MYSPAPFLITTGALTSIFSFFFGEYYREREKVYRLWIRLVAYGSELDEDEARYICSICESKERMFRQAKIFLLIMLTTLVCAFIVFLGYSSQYVDVNSPNYQADAVHTWVWYTVIIGLIVLINAIELIYIQVAMTKRKTFPWFGFRAKVTGEERLSMIWQLIGCNRMKRPEFDESELPAKFYKDLENPKRAFMKNILYRWNDDEFEEYFPRMKKKLSPKTLKDEDIRDDTT